MADMRFLGDFDATKEAESGGFEPLPEDDYVVAVTESEMKRNKKDTGSYLSLKLQVLDGDCKGRTLFTNLNLDNRNDTAVKIAPTQRLEWKRSHGLSGTRASSARRALPPHVAFQTLANR